MRGGAMTGTRKATGAASGGPIAGDLQSVACVERDECRALDPPVAPVIENDTGPHALSTAHTDHFADDRCGATFTSEIRIMAERRRAAKHGELATGQAISESESAEDHGCGNDARCRDIADSDYTTAHRVVGGRPPGTEPEHSSDVEQPCGGERRDVSG